MHAEQGEAEERLGHEVSVGRGVEAVLEPAGEAQIGRRGVGIEGQGRACQRTGAQRRDVEPATAVEQAVDVARERPQVGQEMVGEQHGLGPLQVGVAG